MNDLLSRLPMLWLGAALIFAIVEVILPSFGFIFVGGAALITGLLAFLILSWQIQVLVFGVAVFLSLFLLKPMLMGRLAKAEGVPSRTDILIRKLGKVTEEIDPSRGGGRVLVEGQDWAANSSQAIPVGSNVIVDSADGITLQVRKV